GDEGARVGSPKTTAPVRSPSGMAASQAYMRVSLGVRVDAVHVDEDSGAALFGHYAVELRPVVMLAARRREYVAQQLGHRGRLEARRQVVRPDQRDGALDAHPL